MYSFSDCLAHPPDDYLKDHLKSVAMANQRMWGKERDTLAIAGILSGLLHDIGKASRWFQDRVNGKDKGKSKYSNHSLPSAIIGWYISSVINLNSQELNRARLSVFVSILRHHSNLKESWADEVMLWKHRLKSSDENHLALLNAQLNSMDLRGIEGWLKEMAKEFELPLTMPELKPGLITKAIISASSLRLMNSFKALEDVIDFLGVYGGLLQFDKIHSAVGDIERKRGYLPQDSVEKYIKECIPEESTNIATIRNDLSDELEIELLNRSNEHFFTLTAPTGSGKTLAVLNSVLKLRKYIEETEGIVPSIIYCLPFTSIIDQNYAVYREVLEHNGLLVNSELLLKHHHLSDPVYISSDPEFDADDSGLFTETWQSELVVTTFYQLLNGIITPRNKNLKRFVSLKDAIVIMDEVQAVPHRYWELIRKLFQIIGNGLNTRFILMTATQPLLFTNDMAIELLPGHKKYFEQLSRIRLVNRADSDTPLEDFSIIVLTELQKNPNQNRMCVLNRKSSVSKLYSTFKERLPDRNIYALSTNLTPKDRKKRIKEIRDSLKSGIPCLIITTQLVEAGVDISADVVDRDMAPLDSIIQSAGRCNRHGSEIKGIVNLWSLTDDHGKLWKRVYDPFLIDATSEVLVGKTLIEEKEFLDLGRAYFKLISERSEPDNVDELLISGKFSEIEAHFKLIENDGPRQSYFIIQSPKDREIWEQYGELNQIEDSLERKKTFSKFKAEFMERIVQVYARSSGAGIMPIESALGLYTEELGFLGNTNMPESVIL
ncbi:CRISPR-associated helicase Cas3' [Thermodesulfovibrionales bacterium]|nr:CRISPR-associated helicase Cas3' [Thermodesulfovibrionales bacterium]